MNIRLLETELFHAGGGWTDGHDEANSRFRNFAKAPKNQIIRKKQVSTSSVSTRSCDRFIPQNAGVSFGLRQ